jgi:hypothetical protein
MRADAGRKKRITSFKWIILSGVRALQSVMPKPASQSKLSKMQLG